MADSPTSLEERKAAMSEEEWAETRGLMCKAVSVLASAPFQSKGAVLEQLCQWGVERGTAWEIVTFLPIAYFRLLLARYEAMFPETFIFCDPSGESQELAYADQPIYQDCLRFARAAFSLGVDPLPLQAIVTHSCEFREVNRLLGEEETPPGDIRLAPPTIYLGDCDDGAGFTSEESGELEEVKAWWEFWK